MEDLETLTDLCKNIAGRTVCAFGDAEVAPIMSTLKHWRHEYVTLIHESSESASNLTVARNAAESYDGRSRRLRLDDAT